MVDANDGGEDFAALLEEYESQGKGSRRGPEVGDTVTGTIISVGREAVFVDLGGKSEGILDLDQVLDADGDVAVEVGDTIEARVVQTGSTIVLRRALGRGKEAKSELVQAFNHKFPVEGVVGSVIKGGLEVQIAGCRAFCPISQIDSRFVENPEEFVGQRLQFRIIKLEEGRSGPNIVVSRRALLEEEAAVKREELVGKLEVGLVLPGVITSIRDYGAFVDIGGMEGMLHISQLSFQRVEHPSEVVSEGQKLEVEIIKIEKTDNSKRPFKIGLSIKSMDKDPWQDAEDRFAAGALLSGKVVRIQPFGAFVEVAPGIEGLVHVSELGGEKRVASPREVMSVGDDITVQVLSVDRKQRRMSLSMNAIARAEEQADIDSYKPALPSSGSGLGTFGDLLKKSSDK